MILLPLYLKCSNSLVHSLFVQYFREPLDGSLLHPPPGNTQASVGELLDGSPLDNPPGNTQATVADAGPPLLDDSSPLPPPVSVQVFIEEVATKNSTG